MSWGCVKKAGCGCLIVTVMLLLFVVTCVMFMAVGGWVYLYEHLGWLLKAADKYDVIKLPWYLKL